MKTYVKPRGVYGADGTALAERMDAADVSLRELAAESGVSRSTLGNLSNGRGTVELEKAKRIAAALGVPARDLFTAPAVTL